jgi:hypothetical protein
MSLLARVHQKIFGSTGATGEFGKFGSDSLGSPATTKDLTLIQSLSTFASGLFSATNNANEPPRIQDINGLYLLFTSQLAYYFQNGIPEWENLQEYYAVISYCQRAGVIYRSVTGTDGSPQTGHDPATDDGTYWEAGDSSLRQLKFDLDRLGFSGYALYTDKYLRDKLTISRRFAIGDYVVGGLTKTPTAFADAQSTAHPTYPEYCPLIPIHDANHDLTTTQTPQWVIDKFLAEKVSLAGTTSWTATLATGVLTFGVGAANDLFLAFLQEQGYVNRWYVSESAGWLASGVLFTGARQQALTIGGVHYAIASMAFGSRTITLATYPANGSVSVEFHPYAIGGSLTSFRLRRISGEALVAAGDITGEVGVGSARMYRLLGHWHQFYAYGNDGQAGGSRVSNSSSVANDIIISQNIIRGAISDTSNSLVTGKSNDPRTAGVAVYVNVGVLLATTYTTAV